jgi:hypothetical protein
MMDLYSRLISRLLVPTATLFGFNKGQFGGRKLSGGRLLSWIEQSAPKSFENGQRLVSILLQHLDAWLQETIELRDAVTHDGGIPGLVEATVSLDRKPQEIGEGDITLPAMPSGEAVTDYGTRLVDNVRILISETLPLLPDVNVGLLGLYEGEIHHVALTSNFRFGTVVLVRFYSLTRPNTPKIGNSNNLCKPCKSLLII